MIKKLIFCLCLILVTSRLFGADTIHCNGSCDTSCSEMEKVSLALLDTGSINLLKKFELRLDSKTSDKQFIDNMSQSLATLLVGKKSISEQCLDHYCAGEGKKSMKIEVGNGLHLSYTNPVCDYSPAQRNPPINMIMVLLSGENGTISQMMYTKKGNDLTIMLKTPSKQCKDSEGGTFNNKFVASTTSLAIVPDEGTTKVENTPVGAQLIKKKKSVVRMTQTPEGHLLFDMGEGYHVEVNPQSRSVNKENILNSTCKGNIIRNPAKKTSRLGISPSSVNNKGAKVYDPNNYRVVDAEKSKVTW